MMASRFGSRMFSGFALLVICALAASYGDSLFKRPSIPVRSNPSCGYWFSCHAWMKQLANAMELYACEHDGRYPADVNQLVPKFIPKDELWKLTHCARDDSPHRIFVGSTDARLPVVFCPSHPDDNGPCLSKLLAVRDAVDRNENARFLHQLDVRESERFCRPGLEFIFASYPNCFWIQCVGDHPGRPDWVGPSHGSF